MKEVYIPEGRKPGQPVVEVSKSVVRKLGKPNVDYDKLDRLFREDLGVSSEVTPKVKLYGRFRGSPIAGFHLLYSDTVHVNAVASNFVEGPDGVNKTLAHEGKHLADSKNHPVRSMGEYLLRGVVLGGARSIGNYVASVAPGIGQIFRVLFPAAAVYAYYVYGDPGEKRARKFEAHAHETNKSTEIIVFEKTAAFAKQPVLAHA